MSRWWTSARENPFFRRGITLALVVIVLDQLTKHWILYGLRLHQRVPERIEVLPFFDLSYVENTGVSFGLFSGGLVSRVLLSILALVVAGFVLRWLGTLHRRVAALGAGFIIGGALGNVYDRLLYGYVVDFLDFSQIGFPWVFNVADAAINIGVACLAWDAFVVTPRMEAEKRRGAGAQVTETPDP